MLEKMSKMIAEQLNCDASEITSETSFKDDLGADSLDLFELVMALEDEYNVEIPAEELTDLTTVGAVIRIESRKTTPNLGTLLNIFQHLGLQLTVSPTKPTI